MPGEKDDLMADVGKSFGITDEPAPQGDNGADEADDNQPQQQPDAPDSTEGGVEDGSTPGRAPDPRTNDKDAARDQLFTDKPKKGPKGELLDRNGQVVAATRREKQLAYNLNRTQYAANQVARENKRLMQVLNTYSGIDQQMKQHQLTPEMMTEAMQLRAMAEKDPVAAVRDIVARVLATGVTMEQLFGTDAVPQINARVITNELDKRLGPVEQRARREQQQEQINERAQEQMERFVYDHPHAETHGVEISNLVSNHGLTPERAYFELRSWTERRGFDFTAPLRPQIEAAMRRQPRGNGGGAPRRAPSTPGDMRGVAPNGGVPTQNTGNSRGDFKSNTPWRDIASAVFNEINHK